MSLVGGPFLIGASLLVGTLGTTRVVHAQAPAAPPPIEDNSFLLEEAYNQERGVVQHISSFTRYGASDWAYTFTQEWPLGGRRHQLSGTLSVLGVEGANGVGDLALNYRLQALDGRTAMAPRLSLVVPTGSRERGLGTGGLGWQVNLPLSVSWDERFVSHSNLGGTWVPNARNPAGDEAATWSWNLGQSLVWLTRPRLNLLVEVIWTRSEEVIGVGLTERADTLHVSPGIRWAYDSSSGLQIVPGLAVPIGVGPSSGDTGLLVYLSFEHPFLRER